MAATNAFSLAENSLLEYTGQTPPVYSGGGKGQVARVQFPVDGELTEFVAKGTSRYAALVGLLEQVRAAVTAKPDPVEKRATMEDVLDALAKAGQEPDIIDPDDDDKDSITPQPVWEGTRLVRLWPCVAECMVSEQPICDCKCQGGNHGLGFVVLLVASGVDVQSATAKHTPVRYGEKYCQCGCGETTFRRFVPGHDARYHGRQRLVAWALAPVNPEFPNGPTNYNEDDILPADAGDLAVWLGLNPEIEQTIRDGKKRKDREAKRAAAKEVTPAK